MESGFAVHGNAKALHSSKPQAYIALMRKPHLLLATAGCLLLAATAPAVTSLAALTQKDASAGLREALTRGASAAIDKLGVADGFLGNPEVKIPLPGRLQQAEKTLRMLGLGPRVDELVTTMNRAAEAAVPAAKPLFIDAVKQMSLADAKTILSGGDDAGTQYFRKVTGDKLGAKLLPIIKTSTDRLRVANKYNAIAGQASKFGLVGDRDAKIEDYVTAKALDGLFLMMAQEERALRKDPMGQASALLQKVFGALKK
jgi:hypothetical protein